MIKRQAANTLKHLASQYKAVAVIGPRQSGKTTLVKHIFPEKVYVSLENPDTRLFATDDPRGFLANYPNGAILDEAQRVPSLFAYLQQILDESGEMGLFIITGSNNFLLQESISQSLAGRIAYLNLLPLTIAEINKPKISQTEHLLKGGYPILWNKESAPDSWMLNYISTYLERDVRLIKNINNLLLFERFIRICAGRIGQLLNMSSIANEIGADSKTVESWLSVLESSFIIFRLRPFHRNYNKRTVKMAKLYFYDTGLACTLLGIKQSQHLEFHPAKGALFENLIVVDFLKEQFNKGGANNLYFWRDSTGNEIDLIIDHGNSLSPVEIKSSETIVSDYFKGINYWNTISGGTGGMVVYGGDENQKRSNGIEIVSFKQRPPMNI